LCTNRARRAAVRRADVEHVALGHEPSAQPDAAENDRHAIRIQNLAVLCAEVSRTSSLRLRIVGRSAPSCRQPQRAEQEANDAFFDHPMTPHETTEERRTPGAPRDT